MKEKFYYSEYHKLKRQLGINIKVRRLNLNLTQEELAELSNTDSDSISRLERGTPNSTLYKIMLVAKGLGCSIKDLLPD